jgi:hypothetical protein
MPGNNIFKLNKPEQNDLARHLPVAIPEIASRTD